MDIERWLTGCFKKTVSADANPRNQDNTNIYLSMALQKATSANNILFPVNYIEFIRDCLEPKACEIREIRKEAAQASDIPAKRFSALVDALARLPPIETAIAEKIALIADALRGNGKSVETDRWAGDVRAHFEMSSSFGANGRILVAIIRFMRCTHCLELGTAYGMSALFMLEALAAQGPDTRLTTVEGSELQYALSSELLSHHYGDKVFCAHGWTSQILPGLTKSLDRVDFLFHDAGHSRQDYNRDFNAVLPVLAPGAVVLIDDIRWHDPRFYKGNPRCYAGWREIANHPRARRAIEIGDGGSSMGLLLLGG